MSLTAPSLQGRVFLPFNLDAAASLAAAFYNGTLSILSHSRTFIFPHFVMLFHLFQVVIFPYHPFLHFQYHVPKQQVECFQWVGRHWWYDPHHFTSWDWLSIRALVIWWYVRKKEMFDQPARCVSLRSWYQYVSIYMSPQNVVGTFCGASSKAGTYRNNRSAPKWEYYNLFLVSYGNISHTEGTNSPFCKTFSLFVILIL